MKNPSCHQEILKYSSKQHLNCCKYKNITATNVKLNVAGLLTEHSKAAAFGILIQKTIAICTPVS
jgi:hypothetical protein